MKLDIPFHYKQSYIPKGCYKQRERDLQDTVTVDITEPEESNFPIAFLVKEHQWLYNPEIDDTDFAVVTTPIRVFNGKLYRPNVEKSGKHSGIPHNEKHIMWVISGNAGYAAWIYKEKDYIPYDENAKIVSETKEIVINTIQEHAREHIFFEGLFWERCGEPMYLIETFGLGHNHGGTAMFIEYFYNDNISNRNYFTALQRNEAVQYGKRVALGRGDTNYIETIEKSDLDIEVCMPEMVKRNPQKDHGAGDAFMNSLEQLIEASDSANEAGILVMLETAMRTIK